MSDRIGELSSTTEVVLVTFTEPEALVAYEQRQSLELTVITDPSRAAYRAFGLGRGSTLRVYGVRAIRRYVQLFRRDGWRRLERATEDTRQLGGDFVVDPEGRLTWGFWGEGPDDRPEIDELLTAAERAGGPAS